MNAINANKTLIDSISVSIEAMKTDIRDIANFIVIERKIEKDQREDRRFEEQDISTKGKNKCQTKSTSVGEKKQGES